MANPSHRYRALGELTQDELEQMLAENETLFVEHKRSLGPGDSNYQLAKAIASFANGLGGWVLVGVDPDGSLNSDQDEGFRPPAGGALIDRVRQALENEGLDPLPPIAAKVTTLGEQQLGVVRVYESSDTPHLLGDGTIYIREPAQDRRSRWLPAGADSHRRVVELALRGEQGRAAAEQRLRPGALPFTDAATVGGYEAAADGALQPRATEAAVAVRLAPLGQLSRFREWALSQHGVEAAHRMASGLVGLETPVGPSEPHANGIAAHASEHEMQLLFGDVPGLQSVARDGTAVIDGGGVLGVRLGFRGPERQSWINLQQLVENVLLPPLQLAVRELEAAEFYGRFVCHAWMIRLANAVWLQEGSAAQSTPESSPAYTQVGGELTVPALTDDEPGPELAALAAEWARAYARSCGLSLYA